MPTSLKDSVYTNPRTRELVVVLKVCYGFLARAKRKRCSDFVMVKRSWKNNYRATNEYVCKDMGKFVKVPSSDKAFLAQ